MKEIEFLDLVIHKEKMNLGLSKKKLKHVFQRCQKISHATKNFSLKSHKVNYPDFIKCPGYFTSTNPGLTSLTGTVIRVILEKLVHSHFFKWFLIFPSQCKLQFLVLGLQL